MTKHIEIQAGSPADSFVKVNGEMLSRVRKVELNMEVDTAPTVTVEMVTKDAHFEGDAQLIVREVPPERIDSKTNLETSYDLRKQYEEDVDNWKTVGKTDKLRVLVVAVQFPNGNVETITNHGDEQIREKLEYYLNTYDEYFSLKHNKEIRIIAYFLV